MGLIKAAAGALGGGLADQWREYFYCDSLDAEILVAKGEKRVSGRSSNKKGDENIISNGSVIAVNKGQCMIIVEQGKIVDVCAEPGEFTYDSSTEPSIFYGPLGENIKKSFAQFGRRFTFGGDTAKDQRVYFVNTKEITGNKFGTPSPIPFRVIVDENLGYKLSVDLRCSGIYSYKIVDPVLFYTNVCANVTDVYERSNIEDNLRGELLNALQPALANISAQKIMYYEIPAHTKEVSEALETELATQWRGERGIEIFTLSFNTVSIPEDQRKKLTEWEENAMTTNSNTAAARLVGGQVEAMKAAASNTGGMGAMGGFFGMNMAQNAGGAVCRRAFPNGSEPKRSKLTRRPEFSRTRLDLFLRSRRQCRKVSVRIAAHQSRRRQAVGSVRAEWKIRESSVRIAANQSRRRQYISATSAVGSPTTRQIRLSSVLNAVTALTTTTDVINRY